MLAVKLDLDALVSAREAQDHPGLKALGVCRHMICDWRRAGRLVVRRTRGRSPLYRFGDILQVDRAMRLQKRYSHRVKVCRSCSRVSP